MSFALALASMVAAQWSVRNPDRYASGSFLIDPEFTAVVRV
jgi:hypothetical protein